MRTVSIRLSDLEKASIPIGFVGENMHTQVRIDCLKLYEEYPYAAASLTVEPPKGDPYPAVVVRDGDVVVWDIQDSDLIYQGNGAIQLAFTVDEVIAKSYVGRTRISKSIIPTGEVPTPIENFIIEAGATLTAIPETINEALAEAKASGEFDGAPGHSPAVTASKVGHVTTISVDGEPIVTINDGIDGQDGHTPVLTATKSGTVTTIFVDGVQLAQINDGQDGHSPVITASKNGKTTTIYSDGTQIAQVVDGADADPTTIIDDTSTAENKVWSADKTNSLLSAINGKYTKPSGGIPATDLADGVIPDITGKADKTYVDAQDEALNNAKAPVILDSASGAVASFPDGADNLPLSDCTISIEPVQDLHGQANPYPTGGGDNILDVSTASPRNATITGADNNLTLTATEGTYNRVAFNVAGLAGKGTCYVSGKFTRTGTSSSNVCLQLVYNDGTVHATNLSTYTNDVCDVTDSSFSVPSGVNSAVIYVYLNNADADGSGITVNAQNFRISAKQNTSWTPYSNICPISGWTGCNVSRTGKNVWDEVWENGSINDNTGQDAIGSGIRSKDYIPVVPNTSYYIYVGNGAAMRAFFYGKDKTYLSRIDTGSTTFTVPSNAYYMRFRSFNAYGTTYNNDISINYPSTDTAYHAYVGNTYPISWQTEAGTVYGGTLDVTTGVLKVDRASVDMGSLIWEYNSNQLAMVSTSLGLNVGDGQHIMCSQYKVAENIQGSVLLGNDKCIAFNKLSTVTTGNFAPNVLVVKDTAYTDKTTFTTAMSGVQLVYELATPVTYQLTTQEIKSLLGQNNIFADCGNASVTYRADTKLYVDQQLSASQRLMELIVTANREDAMKATKAYSSGDLLIVNGTLYKASTSIANGATLTIGTNVTATTVANELALLA